MGEGGHWYDPITRKLVLEVPMTSKGREGEVRPPTLRDARKYGWRPSVTTLLSILAKPGLDIWKVQEAVRTTRLFGRDMLTPEVEYVKRIVEASQERVEEAAEFGTKVHYALSMGFIDWSMMLTNTEDPYRAIANEVLNWCRAAGLECERSEHSFISPLGWAGTVDFLGTYQGKPVIVDFKTQEFDNPKDANFYDPEHPLQLAGYDLGVNAHTVGGLAGVQYMSIIISRTTLGCIATKIWPDQQRYRAAFLTLWELWKLLKGYDPVSQEAQAEWQEAKHKQEFQRSPRKSVDLSAGGSLS